MSHDSRPCLAPFKIFCPNPPSQGSSQYSITSQDLTSLPPGGDPRHLPSFSAAACPSSIASSARAGRREPRRHIRQSRRGRTDGLEACCFDSVAPQTPGNDFSKFRLGDCLFCSHWPLAFDNQNLNSNTPYVTVVSPFRPYSNTLYVTVVSPLRRYSNILYVTAVSPLRRCCAC